MRNISISSHNQYGFIMYFTRLSIAVLLAPFIASCQSYTSKVDKALPTESPPVIQTPVIQTPAIEVSAVMMNSIIYNEIISQLPEDDKFGGFSDKYTKLINRYNSIYYSDVLISEWDQIDKKYKLPAVILNSIA